MGGRTGPRPSGVMDRLAILTRQLHDLPPLSTPTLGAPGSHLGGRLHSPQTFPSCNQAECLLGQEPGYLHKTMEVL